VLADIVKEELASAAFIYVGSSADYDSPPVYRTCMLGAVTCNVRSTHCRKCQLRVNAAFSIDPCFRVSVFFRRAWPVRPSAAANLWRPLVRPTRRRDTCVNHAARPTIAHDQVDVGQNRSTSSPARAGRVPGGGDSTTGHPSAVKASVDAASSRRSNERTLSCLCSWRRQ